MISVFIVHGAYGSPQENWIAWLMSQLDAKDVEAIAPTFPTPEGQTYAAWKTVFDAHASVINSTTVLVGHSLGVAFLLRALEDIEFPVRSTFLVSGFYQPLNNPDFDTINHTFTDHEFNWSKIRKNSGTFTVFHGDDDPYVPRAQGMDIADRLFADYVELPAAGHCNTEAGYTEFPELWQKMEKLF